MTDYVSFNVYLIREGNVICNALNEIGTMTRNIRETTAKLLIAHVIGKRPRYTS